MARVEYAEEDVPELAPLVERIKRGRRGNLLKLYKLLLHNPAVAGTWFDHLGAVRWQTELDGRLRELVIIRIALVTQTAYLVTQHVPTLAAADGVSTEACAALLHWPSSNEFSAAEKTALAYADAMTRNIVVPDEIYRALEPHFTARQIVDLTVLVATYNMHLRVVQALAVETEDS